MKGQFNLIANSYFIVKSNDIERGSEGSSTQPIQDQAFEDTQVYLKNLLLKRVGVTFWKARFAKMVAIPVFALFFAKIFKAGDDGLYDSGNGLLNNLIAATTAYISHYIYQKAENINRNSLAFEKKYAELESSSIALNDQNINDDCMDRIGNIVTLSIQKALTARKIDIKSIKQDALSKTTLNMLISLNEFMLQSYIKQNIVQLLDDKFINDVSTQFSSLIALTLKRSLLARFVPHIFKSYVFSYDIPLPSAIENFTVILHRYKLQSIQSPNQFQYEINDKNDLIQKNNEATQQAVSQWHKEYSDHYKSFLYSNSTKSCLTKVYDIVFKRSITSTSIKEKIHHFLSVTAANIGLYNPIANSDKFPWYYKYTIAMFSLTATYLFYSISERLKQLRHCENEINISLIDSIRSLQGMGHIRRNGFDYEINYNIIQIHRIIGDTFTLIKKEKGIPMNGYTDQARAQIFASIYISVAQNIIHADIDFTFNSKQIQEISAEFANIIGTSLNKHFTNSIINAQKPSKFHLTKHLSIKRLTNVIESEITQSAITI